MKQRIIGILLTLCMVLSLLPVTAGASNVLCSGTCGEQATWTITDDGVMTISGTGTVTQPLPYEGANEHNRLVKCIVIEEGITEIGDWALCRYAELEYTEESLYLPDSLQTIGNYAFAGHSNLREVRFGSGLKEIRMDAFTEDASLEAVELPESLVTLGDSAFSSCSALRTVTIPGGIRWLPQACFAHCTGLESVVLEDGIDTIWQGAFSNCTSLKEVRFPETLRKLRSNAFENCTALETMRLPCVERISNACFRGCTGLKSLVIGDGTESIGESAFSGCSGLEEIFIPSSVTTIDNGAFSGCTALKDVYYIGSEAELDRMQVGSTGNAPLYEADLYLLPAMPDPVFGLYDMPEPDNWAYPGVAFCLASGLMNGMGNGYFRPDGTTTRAQLVTILWRMMDEPEAAKPAPFTDLTQDWYREAVAWAAETGVTTGTSATTFSPDAPVTREQMVTIFYRLCRDYLELDVSPAVSLAGFPDSASVSPWAQDAMQWGVAVKLINGVAAGGSVYLQPQGSATRAQIATVMRNFSNAFAGDTGA